MKVFIGTVIANDRNGRMVDIPQGAQTIRVTEVGGKNGGGVRIDYALVLAEPQRQPTAEEAQQRIENLSEDELASLEAMVEQARQSEKERYEATQAHLQEEADEFVAAQARLQEESDEIVNEGAAERAIARARGSVTDTEPEEQEEAGE